MTCAIYDCSNKKILHYPDAMLTNYYKWYRFLFKSSNTLKIAVVRLENICENIFPKPEKYQKM